MSAIVGIVHFNNERIPIDQSSGMMKTLKQFPADDVQTWQKNNVFLGCHAQWITPESVGERLPFYDDESKLVITSDAIIDNRKELFERLQISPLKQKEITDSELILLAYLKWGKDSPKYLIGDFAFMIWDERKQLLFGARDFSGTRTLYYYKDDTHLSFCTIMEPLFKLPYINKALNEDWLAEFIVIPTMVEAADVHMTVYKNIYQLPPAHTITVEKGRVCLNRYWELCPQQSLKLKCDEEYEEAFHEVFNLAVSEKLRTYGEVGSHLSGGLDSGTVVSFAAKALKKENKSLHTFSYVPEDGFIDWTPKYYLANERPFIKETVQYVGNIKDNYLNFAGEDPYSSVNDFLQIMEMPYKFFENAFWLKGINEQASKQGIKILLNGSRGNHSISWGSWRLTIEYYANLLKNIRLIQFNQELDSYCKTFKTGKKVMLPAVIKNAFPTVYSLFTGRKKSEYQFLSFINPDFAKKTNIYNRLTHLGVDLTGNFSGDLNRYRRQHYDQLYFWNKSGTATTKLSLRYSLWDRDPTNDLRVIEFCLSLPEEQYVKYGMERSFLRRATKDILPEKVRFNHHTRGIQGADTIHRMQKHWRIFVDELQQLRNDSMLSDILHMDIIKNSIEYIGSHPSPDIIWTDQFKVLVRSLIVYRFIKTFG